jgi:uncharacterized protein YfbU (UPF0304 family)
VSEVIHIIEMWTIIEEGYAKLSEADKERVAREAEPFGKSPKFAGFDGNNESEHMGIARVLIDDLGRFQSLKGRYLNSHSPSLESHRRMLKLFRPMRRTVDHERGLEAAQLVALLQEKTHPSMR